MRLCFEYLKFKWDVFCKITLTGISLTMPKRGSANFVLISCCTDLDPLNLVIEIEVPTSKHAKAVKNYPYSTCYVHLVVDMNHTSFLLCFDVLFVGYC